MGKLVQSVPSSNVFSVKEAMLQDNQYEKYFVIDCRLKIQISHVFLRITREIY